MPACMAHYQFGQEVLERLEEEQKTLISVHRREFELGLQGPDLFFYWKPYRKNDISGYGSARHAEPGRAMFGPMLEQGPQGAARAYLMGLVCHYALDRRCHPYINRNSPAMGDHMTMESAFDRHIRQSRGLNVPRYRLIPARGVDFAAVASLWRGQTEAVVGLCAHFLRRDTRLLDLPGLRAVCAVAGRPEIVVSMSLPGNVSGGQVWHARRLDELYRQALEEAPRLIERAAGRAGEPGDVSCGFTLNHEGEEAYEPT